MEHENITSNFEKELLDKIDARILFASDIQTLHREHFISDTKMVRRLLRYCITRKQNDITNLWAEAKENVSELLEIMEKKLSDAQIYRIRKNLERKIYG